MLIGYPAADQGRKFNSTPDMQEYDMPHSKTSARSLIATERRVAAFEMRKRGLPYTQIAKSLGISTPAAYTLVKKKLQQLNDAMAENVETVRYMEVHRLDAMLGRLWPAIQKGETKAIDSALRIMERRARYLGLDAPSRLMLTEKEAQEFAAFKEKLKRDTDLRGAFDIFLAQVRGESPDDTACVLDNMMRVLAEMSAEADQVH
jgi:hypothetical protein